MPEKQDSIYFLPGDDEESLKKSPLLEKFEKHDVEVLLLTDPIDEFCMQHLAEYEKFKLKSISKEDGGLFESDEDIKKKQLKIKEMYKPLTDWWKQLLEKDVEKVQISDRLVDEQAYVFTSQYGYSAHMEKINRAQAFANQDKAASYMLAKKHFEINPSHPVMKEMLDRIKSAGGEPDEETSSLGKLIYEVALLNSGFELEDTSSLNTRIGDLIKLEMGISKDAQVEELEIDLDDLDEEELEEDLPDDYDEDDFDEDDDLNEHDDL